MARSNGSSGSGGPTAEKPPIEAEAYYRVDAPARFTFRRVEFGPLAETEVQGAFLTELLAAPEGAGVAGYARVDG